jgi:hypothetical protein
MTKKSRRRWFQVSLHDTLQRFRKAQQATPVDPLSETIA